MELRSDYRVLENNCQHFAKSLIRDITGKDLGPRTIAELMSPFIHFVDNARSLARLRTNTLPPTPTSPHRTFINVSGMHVGIES
jgi:hypothetical protein